MKAVILAAGEGARMGPFTASVPKVMIPVGNRPLLESAVQALVENGVRDLVFVVGYRRERIQSHFQDGKSFHARITYVTQQKQLGTAHGVSEARPHLEGPFLVLNGSNMVDGRFVEDLLGSDGKPAVLITQSERPRSYGVVTVEGKNLVGITEKPTEVISNLINTGAYALDERIFEEIDRLAKVGKHDLPSAVSALAQRTPVLALRTEGTWVDALYPWDLLRLNATALKAAPEVRAGTIEPAVTIRGRVSIGDGCVSRSGRPPRGFRERGRADGRRVARGPSVGSLDRRRRRDREWGERRPGDRDQRTGPGRIGRPAPRDDPGGCGGPVDVRDRRIRGASERVAHPVGRPQAARVPRVRQRGGRDHRERPASDEGQGVHREPRGPAPGDERIDRLRAHPMGDPRAAVEGERAPARRLHGEDRAGPQRDHRELREPAGEAGGPRSHVRKSDGHGEPGPPDRVALRGEPGRRDPEGAA